MTFPLFDAQRRCPKCGGDASVKYHGAREHPFDLAYPNTTIRRCTRCNHAWYETPLDRAAPDEPDPDYAFSEGRSAYDPANDADEETPAA